MARKIFFSCVVVLAITGTLLAEGFRELDWGAPESEAVAAFGEPNERYVLHGMNVLKYLESVAGKGARTHLFFLRNKLIHAEIWITEEMDNSGTQFADTYLLIKDRLKSKYGVPAADGAYWTDGWENVYPDEMKIVAIRNGHLTVGTRWELRETIILEQMDGFDKKYRLGIIYASKKYDSEFQAAIADKGL